MLAVVYDKSEPNNLVLKEVEKPIPKEDEVLVKIHAVSVNAADYRSMKLGIIPKQKIFGADIAGKIEAVGSKIRKFRVGDEVFGDISSCGFGGFAEYAAVPERFLARKPESITYDMAAALPMASITALQALRNKGNIHKGDKVLICGAGGGVGTFAVQLAKYFGAEVTAVCSEKNAKLVKSLGADYLFDYNKQDFSREGKYYNLVLGINGNYSLSDYKRILAPKGNLVIIGGALSQLIKVFLFGVFISISGRKRRILAAKPDCKDLEFVMKLVEEGRIKPVIESYYPFNETAQAMRYLALGHASGKVIINVVPK